MGAWLGYLSSQGAPDSNRDDLMAQLGSTERRLAVGAVDRLVRDFQEPMGATIPSFIEGAGTSPSELGEDTLLNRRILIPGGTFEMGSGDGWEGPTHVVSLSSFRIQQHEVTNEEYERFEPGRRATMSDACDGDDSEPVRCVTWYEGSRLRYLARWTIADGSGVGVRSERHRG